MNKADEYVPYGTKLTDRDLMILGIVFGFDTTQEFEGFAYLQEAKHQAKGKAQCASG
jgi:hypothetical protein